jgi:hypothetical protein
MFTQQSFVIVTTNRRPVTNGPVVVAIGRRIIRPLIPVSQAA